MIKKSASASFDRNPIPSHPRLAPSRRDKGFSLLEGMVSIFLLGSLGSLLFSAFSFSFASKQEARLEMEAARNAGQIIEVLRATSFDAIDLVEDGTLALDPLGKFQALILSDISDRLHRDGLSVYLTVRKHENRDNMKHLTLTIASNGVSPHISKEALPPGKILVKQSTYITRKGINP